MRPRGQQVSYHRTSRCTACGHMRRHNVLTDPAAFHALGRSSIFCDDCGHPARCVTAPRVLAAGA